MSNISGTAVDAPYGFKFRLQGSACSRSPEYRTLAGTIKAGDLGIIDPTTGNIVIHTAAADEKIFGIADQGGVSGDVIQITPIYPDDILVAQSTSATVVAQTDVGDLVSVGGTTGVMGLDVGTATNAPFVIWGLDVVPGFTIGKWCELQCKLIATRAKVSS